MNWLVGVLAAPILALPVVAQRAPVVRAPVGRTHVVLLGTGTPNPDPDRSGPAVAIVVDSSVYIVDAGPGIVRRVAAAARATKFGALEMPKLKIAFLTHLHSDHTVGLPDLMLSPWVLGRTVPLEVYGPPGTQNMVEHLQAAYAEDIDLRLHRGEPSNKTGYTTNAHEVLPGIVYQDSLVKVTAFAVPHGKWEHAYGYRFDTPDRSIVISGDTSPSDAVAEACHGCDVLLHEVITEAHLAVRTPDWQAYHRAYHTPAPELGRVAAKAKPRLLLLYHLIPTGFKEAELLGEVHRAFKGRVVVGRDLGVY
jgi:ribonuclease BN (tRNA processing enzyme)